MPRLKTLNSPLSGTKARLRTLTAQPGIEQRIQGRAGVKHRAAAKEAAGYLCVACYAQQRITLATIVDHLVPLIDGGSNDPSNLNPLCAQCHDIKTAREASARARRAPLSLEAQQRRLPTDIRASGIPITMVCGPPGSGKSSYVLEHIGPDDIIIDLDQIEQKLSGLPEHHTGTGFIRQALEERNRILRSLCTHTKGAAWFIIACPSPRERQQWARMLGATIVLLDVPLDECKRRILSDRARPQHTHQRMIAAAEAWWRINNDGGVL